MEYNTDYKQEIQKMIDHTEDKWILMQIYRFIKNITK